MQQYIFNESTSILMILNACLQQSISVYYTNQNLSIGLQQQKSLQFGTISNPNIPQILVDTSIKYQTIDGFGASLTDAAAWVLAKKMNSTQLDQALDSLFSRNNGISLSFLRQPLAASDLSVTFYTYDDLCNQTLQPCTSRNVSDPQLTHFSIAHDQEYIIPLLRKILKINPDLLTMLTPWSPPGWMKTTGNMDGYDQEIWTNSSLLKQYFSSFAQYHTKTILAYEAAGVPIYGLTVQNEPMWLPPMSMGMWMLSGDQIVFIRDYLVPDFQASNITAKIMVYDWNWGDRPEYPEQVLTDSSVYNAVAGTSWHHYAGNASQMSIMHDRFPEKDQWVTEASGFYGQSGNVLTTIGKELIESIRNYARSYIVWGLVTDEVQGPHTSGGCGNCRGVITVNTSDLNNITVKKEYEYFALGHVTKFLHKNAIRIASSEPLNTDQAQLIQNVAFMNPDGSIVLYVVNSDRYDHEIEIVYEGQGALINIEGGGVMTFVWPGGK